MELTAAELTILGLLIEAPRHGYELEQVIERRGIREWTELGFSSIYYILGKLERRDLVSAQHAAGPRTRRVFEATDAGVAAARAAVRSALADPQPAFSAFPVALANIALLSTEERDAATAARLAAIGGRIDAVRAAAAAQHPLPPTARAVFSYSLALLEAERDWLSSRGPEGLQ